MHNAQTGTASFSRAVSGGAATSDKLRETFRFTVGGKQLEVNGQLHIRPRSRYTVEKRVVTASTTLFHSSLHAQTTRVAWKVARRAAAEPLVELIAPLAGEFRFQRRGMDDR